MQILENERIRQRRWLVPVVLLCAAFALWMSSLNTLELWGDELFTKVVTTRPLPEILKIALIDAVHPPLYYLLIHLWQGITGSSNLALRLPSVLAMLLGTATITRIAREINGLPTSWVALLLTILNPFLFWYAQEIRMYAQLFALAAAEILLLILALKGRRGAWSGSVVTTALLLNTHYFGFFVLLPSFAFLFAERRWRRKLWPWMIARVIGGLTFAPWLYAWFNRDPKYIGVGWIPQLRLVDVPLTLRTLFFSGTESFLCLLMLGVLGGGLAFFAAFAQPDNYRWRQLLVLGWGLPLVLIAMVSWMILPVYVDRYLIILLPSLVVWISWGIDGLSQTLSRVALICLAVGMVGGLIGTKTQPQWKRPQWRKAMEWLQEASNPSDEFLASSTYVEPARLAYAPNLTPFTRLISRNENLPGERPPEPHCDQEITCWVVWEDYAILMHFPPVANDPGTIVEDLAVENTTAAWLLDHREQCEIYSFTHIEVWRCGD